MECSMSGSNVRHSVMSDFAIPQTVAYQVSLSTGSSIKNTGVVCHSLLQRIFPTQEANPALLHCRQILDHLSYREIHWNAVETPYFRKIYC